MLPSAPQHSSDRGRSLVTAFRSPATALRFRSSIPGSKFLACHFATNPEGFTARSALLLRCQIRFAPVLAASTLLARCSFPFRFDQPLSRSPLPFGIFTSLRIKAFNRFGYQSTRLPNTPDLRLLPTAVSITRFGCGSSFADRYVSGGLLEIGRAHV